MGTKARTNKTDPAEYRRYLEARLSQTRSRIKMADAVTGVTIVIVAWVSYLLIAVMADQVVELSATVRLLLLSVCLLVTGSILVVKVILPSLKQVNTRFAARSIESADQRMKNSVLSYVELSEHSAELPAPILRTIENKAANDLSRIRIEDAIQPRHVLSALYFLAAVVVLFCLYSFFTTKSFGASIERVLLPLGATTPPTSTQLRIVFDPGATDPTEPTPIPADSSITFKASVIRGNPEQVMAYLQAEGSDYEEPHELARSESLKSEFTLTLHQRQKTFSVRFVANDFRSKQYKIVVTPAPMITEWLLRYTPPSYTGEESFTSTTPDITGLEGTEVAVEAGTNLPIAANSGRIEFKLAKPTASVDMKLVDGSDNRMAGEFTLTGDGSYTVLFSDREGRSPLFRPSNNIRVLKDLAPVVEFIQPAEKESSLPANRPLHLVARIKDDYGLRGYTLTLHKRGSEESPIIFEQGNLPGVSLDRSESINETVDLSRWKLADGDVVEYWIEAEDNKLPASNTTDTRKDSRIVRITRPIEDQPLVKNDQPQNSSGENKPSPQGERKENEPSSEVASTDKEQGTSDAGSQEREDGSKTDEGSAPGKNEPNVASSPPSNDESKENRSEQESGTDQDALRKEMQREKGSADSDRPQGKGESSDRSNKGDSSSKADDQPSSEDEKELEKLREYFEKKSGSSDDSKRNHGDTSSKDSHDREAMKSSNDSGSSKESTNNREEKSADQKQNPSGTESNDKSSKQSSNAKEDEKKSSGKENVKEDPAEKSESATKHPDESAQKKDGDKSEERGESNKNPSEQENSGNEAENGKGSNESGDDKSKPSDKNQNRKEGEDSSAKDSLSENSAKASDKQQSEMKREDSEKRDSQPSQQNSGSSEKEAEPANQKPKKADEKPDSTEEKHDSVNKEREQSSEPKTGRRTNEQSQQKSGGDNSKNASQESGNNSSAKQNTPESSDGRSPQNQPEQKPGGNEQQKSDESNETKAGSEAKPNAKGDEQSSDGEKQSGQESQSQSGDSGNSSKSSEEGKQGKESQEGKPTPASDDDTNQSPNRSTKMGNNESSAASKGNSDGSSQEGPSQSPGQKGPGSPSDQKGNESKGQGNEQRTPGEKGSPSQKNSSKNGEGAESSTSSSDKSGAPKSGDEKSSENKDSSSGQKGEPSSSSQKNESSNKQGSESSNERPQSSNSSSDRSKEESKEQNKSSSNSSDSSAPMNEKQTDSSSSEGQNSKEQDSKKSDGNSSNSNGDQNKPQQNSAKGNSSSGDQQPQNGTPSDNSNPGGANDAQSDSPTNRPQGGNKPNPSSDTKRDGTPIDNSGDAPDQDDLKKGSNLILKKLEEQLSNKKVDPDLLKSMGWTEEDARKFYERMKAERPADNVSPLGQEQRRQFGQGTDLRKSTGKSAGKTNDSIQDLYSGKRTPVPPQVRKRFEAYMKSLSETSGGQPVEKAPPPPAGTK